MYFLIEFLRGYPDTMLDIQKNNLIHRNLKIFHLKESSDFFSKSETLELCLWKKSINYVEILKGEWNVNFS